MPDYMWIVLACLGGIVGLFYLVIIVLAIVRCFLDD